MNNNHALQRLLTQAGFTLVRAKKHVIWRCPCAHTQIISSRSHHGGRGDQNAKALIARTLRACAQNRSQAA